jgi:CBS domain containing-hemolysin-like protein
LAQILLDENNHTQKLKIGFSRIPVIEGSIDSEDIIEKIVGDIVDETERMTPEYFIRKKNEQ